MQKKKTYKKGSGTPHVVTDVNKQTVKDLASFGVPIQDIADYLDVGESTINRHYQYIIKTASIQANKRVAAILFKKCVEKEDLSAIIFWLKCRARWSSEDSKVFRESQEALEEVRQIRKEIQNKKKLANY